jgi:hypothetical protein
VKTLPDSNYRLSRVSISILFGERGVVWLLLKDNSLNFFFSFFFFSSSLLLFLVSTSWLHALLLCGASFTDFLFSPFILDVLSRSKRKTRSLSREQQTSNLKLSTLFREESHVSLGFVFRRHARSTCRRHSHCRAFFVLSITRWPIFCCSIGAHGVSAVGAQFLASKSSHQCRRMWSSFLRSQDARPSKRGYGSRTGQLCLFSFGLFICRRLRKHSFGQPSQCSVEKKKDSVFGSSDFREKIVRISNLSRM